jgi:protein-tyrosine-phosphatase
MADSRNILVVCYGNLCRSPMAEGLLRHRLPAEFEVRSAGTHAYGGDPPTGTAQEVMKREAGIGIHHQRSSELTVNSIEWADHIFTMSVRQAELVAALDPRAAERTRLFGAFAPATTFSGLSADPGARQASLLEVPDPMGGAYGDYLECMQRLEEAAAACIAWLTSGAAADAGTISR